MGQWWRLPQEKNSSFLIPYVEFDTPYDSKLVLVFEQKIAFVLTKIHKNCCHQSCTFDSKMHQIVWCPDYWRSFQRSSRPSSCLRGLLLKGKEGRGEEVEGKGREVEREEKKGREGEGIEGEGVRPLP